MTKTTIADIESIGKERHFLMNFICEECNQSHRLHKLESDWMGRLHCKRCNCRYFEIKKQYVTEAHFRALGGKDRVVMREITKINYRG